MNLISKRKLLLPIILLMLSGSVILTIKNMVSRFFEINEFTIGFFDGLATALSICGLVCMVIFLRKYRTLS